MGNKGNKGAKKFEITEDKEDELNNSLKMHKQKTGQQGGRQNQQKVGQNVVGMEKFKAYM